MRKCSSLSRRLLFLTLVCHSLHTYALAGSTTPPVIKNVPADITVDCVGDIPDKVDLEAEDAEDGPFPDLISPVDSPDPSTIDPCAGGVVFRVWTAQDTDGNITRDTQMITVLPDVTPPVINYATVNDTVACDLLTDVVDGYTTWRGEQIVNVGFNYVETCLDEIDHEPKDDFDKPCETRTLVITITDQCGQQATWTGTYTTIDTIKPVLVGIPNDTTVQCDDGLPPPPTVTVLDNCNDLLVPTLQESSTQDLDGTCNENEYQVTRTWVVLDSCGNSAQASQVITVIDGSPPNFTTPPNLTISCDDDENDLNLTGEVTDAVDDCGGVVSLMYVDQKVLGSCANDTIINRTWQATDLCGNAITKVQVITKKDQTAPTFTVPRDTLVDCAEAEDLAVTGEPTDLLDNCDSDGLVAEFSDVVTLDPLCEGKYTIRRTWEVRDNCGNIGSQVQTISVEDLLPPTLEVAPMDMIINCAADVDLAVVFSDWVASRGGGMASDNCGESEDLTWVAYNSGTNDPAAMGSLICPANSDTVLITAIDFVVTDPCGNQRLSTAAFVVLDNIAPIIIDCPQDTVIEASAGQCSASFGLTPPIFTEECSNLLSTEDISISANLTNSAAAGEEGTTPVDPLILNFALAASSPVNAFTEATLSIGLVNADAEAAEEYLLIYGEDGSFLGQTANSLVSCGDSDTTLTITKEQFNVWAEDGVISISLEPFIPEGLDGRFAVNDICTGGTTVNGQLTLTVKELGNISFQYSVDDGPLQMAALSTSTVATFEEGVHEVKYYISDCAGNVDSCSFNLTVADREAPQIDCPSDIVVALETGDCDTLITLPFIEVATDNCPGFGSYSRTLPTDTTGAYLTFKYDPNLNDYLAESREYVFTGVAANALGPVQIVLDLRGDFDSNGAFIEVLDENDNVIGTTAQGVASCSEAGQVSFSLSAAAFNAMAGDGTFVLKIVPNVIVVPPGVVGDGINPCNPALVQEDGAIDSLTYVFVTLEYEDILPSFYTTGQTETPLTIMSGPEINPVLNFGAGDTEVFYLLGDQSGNVDTCSFLVSVQDNEAPVAVCQATTVFINPSGLDDESRSAQELDGGSTDNCMIDTMFLSPSVFTCQQAGSTIMATLTVVDVQGNQSSCSTPIRIEAEAPQPSANSGLCGGDTLFLIANPPAADGGTIFTYRWFNPSGLLISTDENPIIANIDGDDAGAYRVEIEGVTGCTVDGVVQVVIEDLPLTPNIVTSENVCVDEDIVLESGVMPSGDNVMYHWYEGLPPEGNLVQSTTVPRFTVPAPHNSGEFNYYLVIEASGCISQPSAATNILASEIPVAIVNETQVTICEGESIELGTDVTGSDLDYEWTGPNGYFSNAQLPEAITNSALSNAGVYTLVVSRNGCESAPAFTAVSILPKPETPNISDNGPLCTGEDLALVTDNNDASVYHWIAPDLQEFLTTSNGFSVEDVSIAEEGFWRVYVTQFGCDSDVSSSVRIEVNQVPNAIASAQRTDVCTGDELRLLGSPNINGATYLWTGPQGYTASAANPIIEEIADGQAGTFELKITTAEGCADSSEVDIEVIKGVTITAVSNNGTTCLTGPTDIQLISTVFPPDQGGYSYSWTGPGFSSSDSVAVIPNATSLNNGNYQLVVTNENNCVSNSLTTVVDVTDPPVTPNQPTLSAATQAPLCEGDQIVVETNAYTGSAVTYNWSTPNGDIVTEVPSLSINSATIGESGVYSLFVNVDGCRSMTSGTLLMDVNEVPEIQVTSNSPVCSGTPVQLEATLFPTATYQWVGPGEFTSSRANPIINMADSSRHAGTYGVTATIDGCTSEPQSIPVVVLQTPAPPLVSNSSPVCISTPGDLLVLSVDSSGMSSGTMYTWYDESGQIGAEISALNFGLKDYVNYSPGTVAFRAKARLGACISDFSDPTFVVFDEIPNNNAFAGEDAEVCQESLIELQAELPSEGTGLWTLIAGDSSGVVIANPELAVTPVEGLVAGQDYLFRWTLSNGACQDYSADEVLYNVEMGETPFAGEDQLVCDDDTIRLNAVAPINGQGRWTQETSQESLGVRLDGNVSNPEITVRGLEPGNAYKFTWTVSSSCGDFFDETFVRVSDPGPFAGFDREVCNDDGEAMLEADTPLGGEAIWSSITPGVTFSDANEPDAIVSNLQEGENIFVWTIDDAICGPTSRDTISIEYFRNPLAMNDDVVVDFGKTVELDLLANDFVPKEVAVTILSGPGSGNLTQIGTGVFEYTSALNFVGEDELVYELCSEGCACSQATVKFSVGSDVLCKAPTIITPNNDGVNDAFVVPCLLNENLYPQSQVVIFNQWGDEVFRSAVPYENNWMGTYNGEDLPVGTYFYVINYGNDQPSDNGYLVIHR